MAPVLMADAVALRIDADGVLRIGASRVTLDILVYHYRDGASADEIALRFESLGLPEIHAAIAYYLNHRVELDAYLAQRAIKATELRNEVESRQGGGSIRQRLLSRRTGAA